MGRPPERMDLVSEAFGDHPMVIVGPPDHPLAGQARIPKARVASEPFLMREEGSGTRTVFEEFFARGCLTRATATWAGISTRRPELAWAVRG